MSSPEVLAALAELQSDMRAMVSRVEAYIDEVETRVIPRIEALERTHAEVERNAFQLGVDAGSYGLVEPTMSPEDARKVPERRDETVAP